MSTSPAVPNPNPNTTIGELRQQFGPHFAKPHQNTDTLGMLLAHAGVNSLEEYLAKHPPQA